MWRSFVMWGPREEVLFVVPFTSCVACSHPFSYGTSEISNLFHAAFPTSLAPFFSTFPREPLWGIYISGISMDPQQGSVEWATKDWKSHRPEPPARGTKQMENVGDNSPSPHPLRPANPSVPQILISKMKIIIISSSVLLRRIKWVSTYKALSVMSSLQVAAANMTADKSKWKHSDLRWSIAYWKAQTSFWISALWLTWLFVQNQLPWACFLLLVMDIIITCSQGCEDVKSWGLCLAQTVHPGH